MTQVRPLKKKKKKELSENMNPGANEPKELLGKENEELKPGWGREGRLAKTNLGTLPQSHN